MKAKINSNQVISVIDQVIKKDFDQNRKILNFDEYLNLLSEQPEKQLRGSCKYILDVFEYFEKTQAPQSQVLRYKLFDQDFKEGEIKVVAEEDVQNQIFQVLKSFQRQGINNKLILLHGPNGSSKTSITHAIMSGMEHYSLLPQGAVYTYNWIFPVEKAIKGGMGIHDYSQKKEPLNSFAKLAEEDILTKISCDFKDSPFLLIPPEHRKMFLEKLLGEDEGRSLYHSLPTYFVKGDLCHRCKEIFQALIGTHGGDYKKILQYIQVERFYFSKRYRKGIVTIEPQLQVDAQFQQLTINRNIQSLPPSLQSLNFFTLTGDLIDGNRGIIEYSDLLKRPIESFKYLLMACETGAVNVGNTIAYLDTVLLGTTNEFQLDAFKEFPDFTSFKARIELIRVPYISSYTQEQEIYTPDLKQIATEKHIAPHTAWALSLWAVLTRLKKPNSINYPPNVSSIIANLTPLEKAKLYDSGEMPLALTAEERKMLKSSLKKLKEEYQNIPYYEGRMGASAREMKTILYNATQNSEFTCLSPLALFMEMEGFVKQVSEYEFLKQDVKDGYHDALEFIHIVRNEYLNVIDKEVRDAIGLYESNQWEEFLKKYVHHVSFVLKKEKIKNTMTGLLENPDFSIIEEFEKIIDAPPDESARDSFRQNIISQVGAWRLDHPKEPITYAKVFPEFWQKLEKHYYESQKHLLTQMHNALIVYGKKQEDQTEEGVRLAKKTIENMKTKMNYCDHCSKDIILFLLGQKY